MNNNEQSKHEDVKENIKIIKYLKSIQCGRGELEDAVLFCFDLFLEYVEHIGLPV